MYDKSSEEIMKKFLSIFLVLAVLVACVVVCTACGKDNEYDEFAIFKTNNFKDYATLDLNYDDFPTLNAEARWQGLYFVKGYQKATDAHKLALNNSTGERRQVPIEIPAEGEEFANAFDPEKPSLIIIHGVQMGDGRQSNAYYWVDNGTSSEQTEVGDDLSTFFYYADKNVDNKAWNVFYFHYEQFCDAEGSGKEVANMAAAVSKIVQACWTMGEDSKGSKIIEADYIDNANPGDGKWSEKAAFNGAICEFFAAEYTRMINSVVNKYPDFKTNHEEIRIAAHSMGGVMTTSSITLLTALADANKIDAKLLPNRLALLDPYVGDYADSDLTVAWSGKKIGNFRTAYIKGLKYYKKVTGGVVEFYVNSTMGFVPYTAGAHDNPLRYEKELKEICAYTVLYPYYRNVDIGTAQMGAGHNAIREWYFYSYTVSPISVYAESDVSLVNRRWQINANATALNYCASASLPTSELKKIVGKPSIQKVKIPSSVSECISPVCRIKVIRDGVETSKQTHVFIPFN